MVEKQKLRTRKQPLYKEIRNLFETFPENIIPAPSGEEIRGIQPDGSDIAVARPLIDTEEHLGEGSMYKINVGYTISEPTDETRVLNGITRTYIIHKAGKRSEVVEVSPTSGEHQFSGKGRIIGQGEYEDLRKIVRGSNFSFI